MKADFLNNEIWILTFGGAFQRANIYKEKIAEPVKKEFKNALRQKIETLVDDNYSFKVSEEEHIRSIQSIVEFSNGNEFKGFTIPINFGVAQKLLNLYLKYCWCTGRIDAAPLHFPVDRLIQSKLNKEAKDALQGIELKAWTQFEDEKDYKKIIEFAEVVRTERYPDKSLAEMELEIFTRR